MFVLTECYTESEECLPLLLAIIDVSELQGTPIVAHTTLQRTHATHVKSRHPVLSKPGTIANTSMVEIVSGTEN